MGLHPDLRLSRPHDARVSIKCQPSSDDPGDVFLALYDVLDDAVFASDAATRLRTLPSVRAEAAAVEKAVCQSGRVDPWVWTIEADTQGSGILLGRLIGLDRVLQWVHPRSQSPVPNSLRSIAARYQRRGRFNTDPSQGLILPRLVRYGAPTHLEDKEDAFSVVRVHPDQLKRLELVSLGPGSLPTLTSTDGVTVACLPFAEDRRDVEIRQCQRFGTTRYRIAASSGLQLQHRVDLAIDALDHSRALVGVLPEGVLSKELLAVWQRRLHDTVISARREGSCLEIVIVGTGPVTLEEPPRNRAVVLARNGKILWQQDKICDFTFVTQCLNDWRLPELGPGPVLEDITRGDRLVVCETPIGRLAILICEDLQRAESRGVNCLAAGLSHIFTPVFDAPLGPNRWERFAAERHAHSVGTTIVVSNSRVIGNLTNAGQSMTTGLVVGARATEQTTGTRDCWDVDVHQIVTDSPLMAAVVQLAPLGPPC